MCADSVRGDCQTTLSVDSRCECKLLSSTFFSLSLSIVSSQSFLAHLFSCKCTYSGRGANIPRLRNNSFTGSIGPLKSSVLALVCLCRCDGCARFIHELEGGVFCDADSLVVSFSSTLYSQDAGELGHRMEQSLCQKTGTIDKLHQSHRKLQTILFCWKNIEDCKLELFQDASFAADLLHSTPASGGVLGLQHSSIFPGCARSKAQFLTTVWSLKSFSLKVEGLPASQLWDCAVEIVTPHYNAGGNLERLCSQRHSEHRSFAHSHSDIHMWFHLIDHVPSNIPNHPFSINFVHVEDNEAGIRMIFK